MIPENSILLAKTFEGFYPKPYICPAGFWTIGYGHLCKKDHPEISLQQAEEYLAEDLLDSYLAVSRLCPSLLPESPDKIGAITDFTFNLGSGRLRSSTLRRRINDGDWNAVPGELNKWVYGGGRKLRGLVLRRQAEAAFFIG